MRNEAPTLPRLHTALDQFSLPRSGRNVVVVGTFDGVHLAHQELLRRARLLAVHQQAIGVVALTFQNHPRSIVAPELAPKLLIPWHLKAELLAEYGADDVLCIPFDERFRAISATQFIEEILVKHLAAGAVISGPSFHFGQGGEGHVGMLAREAERLGFTYLTAPPMLMDGEKVSSTLIRELLRQGRVARAGKLLGRPPILEGVVVTGDQLGRKIGFPTANLLPDPVLQLPLDGVYAARVLVDGVRHPAMMNLGYRPTVSSREHRVEVHLIDFAGELVGQTLRVELIARLRDEQRFENVEALSRQLSIDRQNAMEALAS